MREIFRDLIVFCIALALIINAGSCVPQACLDVTDANAKASFYETGTGKQQTPSKITLYGLGNDTAMVYNEAASLKNIEIPLNAGSDSCTFIMKINGITDTVTFFYSSYPHLVTKECGYTYYHNLETIENTRPDVSFIITYGKVTTANEENINIFY
jgi:hypothetical protein